MSAEEYDNVPNLENVTTTTKTTKSKTKSKNDGESNLFRVLYGKLRDGVYNPVARLYASLVVNHPLTTLGCYLLLVLSITLGLFQASFVPVAEADATQRLTLLRNSEAENDRARLESTFPFDQSELYFQHKLTTFGYYFEIILNTRPPHGNLANRTILDQFNQLYDEIISLYITEPDEITSERNVTNMRNYTLRDLCTVRVNKCAAEGSVIRLESFQNKLLKGSVCYEQGDPKFMYLDYEAMDGASLKFLFSDDRNETCDNDNCCITEARFIRIRFDLKFETPTQASRSVKFMNAFVDHCETLEREKKYDFFELSYYTSHTMFPEIEKHSIGDVKFVIACFISFWLIYYLFLLFESSSVKRLLRRLCFCCSKKKSSVKESKKPFWVRSPGYLIFVTFLQYIFTGLGTLGFMALCRVKINTMLYSIGFITMIVSCHQSLLIYKNITGHGGHLKKGKRSSRHHRNDDDEDLAMVREQRKELLMKVVSQSSSAPVDETFAEAEIELNRELSREDSDIKRRFIQTSQQILVPAFFSLLSSVSAYCLIGIFSNLDAIRIYSYVLAVSLMFNFIGLVAFFCPSLVLHLRRVKSNRNCLLPLFKHQSTNTESNFSKQPSVKTPKSKTTDRSESKTTPTTYKRIVTDYLSQTVSLAKSGSMLVDNRKVRVVFLLIFLIYNVINVAVIVRLARVNIPVTDALPEKSYLRRHLDLHTRYFKLGPIVSINFMNSQKYWEKQTYTRIRSMLDDMESLRLMWPLELNWLREVRIAVSEMAEQEELNCNESDNASYECFIKQLDFFERPEYKGDYQLSMNADKTEMNITSSRMFLQMAKFEGVWDEWELMNTLKAIAENKYGFSKDELIIHSSVFPMLEQLGELIPATLSQFVLSLECVLAVAILLALVDLASVLVLALVHISFALSLLGNMFAFDLSLSIVTLLHLQMVPAIVIEFFAYMGYLYLFSAVRKRSSDSHHNNISVIEANARFHHNGETKLTNGNEIMETTSENTSSSSSSSATSSSASSYGGDERTKQYAKYPKSLQKDLKRRHRLECVHFAQQGATSTSALFALFVGLFSFSFLAFSSTYNFTSLFIVFASICFNLFLHLYVFYPVLLAFIGATWL